MDQLTRTFRIVENAKREWELAFDCIDDVVMLVDNQDRIVRTNRTLTRLTGRPFQALLGIDWHSVLTQAGMREEITVDGQREFCCPDGACYLCKIHVIEQPVCGETSAVVTLKDITAYKLSQQRMEAERKRFHILAEHAPSGIATIAPDGRFTYLNPRFRAIFGYGADDTLSVRDWFFGMFPDREMRRQTFGAWTKDMEKPRFEEKVPRIIHFDRNGTKRTARVIVAVLPPDLLDGALYLVFSEDITEREEAETRLRESEERYRVAIECSNDGIAMLRNDLHAYVNAKFLEMLGYDRPEELIGRHCDELLHPESLETARRARRAHGMSRLGDRLELSFLRKDGRKIWVEVSAALLPHEENVILAFMRDVTDRRLAEESLKDSRNMLSQKNGELEKAYGELKEAQSRIIQQEKMASIGQLAAGVAHEINNPIGFISSNLNSLGRYADSLLKFLKSQTEAFAASATNSADGSLLLQQVADQRRALKVDYIGADMGSLINESLEGADRVKRIVQDLKNFSRVDERENKPADLNAGLESTINIVWNELKYKATVRKEYGEIPPVVCNLGQLNQVFMNILVNSAQAIETQGEIVVATRADDGRVLVSISDTGCGIPEDKLGRIFEPFFTTKEVGKGTGLGLSIAYDIVKKHEGEIKVTSESGKGTTFLISIPIGGCIDRNSPSEAANDRK